jgi:hypothetical protein
MLRRLLRDRREAGEPFGDAWPAALASVLKAITDSACTADDRAQWELAFRWAEPHFRRGFIREGPRLALDDAILHHDAEVLVV